MMIKPGTLRRVKTRMSLPDYISNIKTFLIEKGLPDHIDSAVILGSGLGDFSNEIEHSVSIPYSEIPDFPQSTVEGHTGSLIFGLVGGITILAFSGRFHFYEGHPFEKTVLPVQLSKAFTVNKLVISNAAGGINFDFKVGDLMVIDDILRKNMMLSGPAPEPWKLDLYPIADHVQKIADFVGVETKRGSYLYVKGPNYETKAEIHVFRKLGADAVGMSTVPELMEAARIGVNAAAISLITNAAAGVTDQKLDHAEVKEAAEMKKNEFAKLVKGLIKEL